MDVALVAVLVAAALPLRLQATSGDLWTDEADYALAAVRGMAANRWDRSDSADEPLKMLRLRHYHPPLTAYAVAAGLARGPGERSIRLPFVAVGALTLGLMYVCGLALFADEWRGCEFAAGMGQRGRRNARPAWQADVVPRLTAAVCAFVLIVTPAHVRASSHALPWAFITLWMLALLWTTVEYAVSRRPGWLVGAGATLGALFVTSEYFFPALLAFGVALAPALWRELRQPEQRSGTLAALAVGALICLAVGVALWPAGVLRGDSVAMLRHYVAMAHDVWPVNVGGRVYARAPKSAYVIWYWRDFRTFFILYLLGLAALCALLLSRGRRPAQWALLGVSAVVLVVAHQSHIIGPEYLVHALPLLTLAGGLFLLLLARLQLVVGVAAALLICLRTGSHHDATLLAGMDARARRPRWADAARYMAAHWQPGDMLLANAYGSIGRWYLLHVAGVPARDWQVQGYPGSGEPLSPGLRKQVLTGQYRFVAAGSAFVDSPEMNAELSAIVERWPVVWRSDEAGSGPSRLVIYERPGGVAVRHPIE